MKKAVMMWVEYHRVMHKAFQGFCYLVHEPGIIGALYRAFA